jgi:hypothetical protein
MGTETFGSYVIDELADYRKTALAKDPNWFNGELNQRAFLDFQMQVMAIWVQRQIKAEQLAPKIQA